MFNIEKYSYRYLFRFIPNFNEHIVSLCYYGCCYGWSSAFYCASRHKVCQVANFSIWQLMPGLPSGDHQLFIDFE